MTKEVIKKIIANYPAEPRYLLPALQDVQKYYRYLPVEAMREVARALGVSESTVYSVATFYKAFSLTPRGRKIIRVCMGTACHLRGAHPVLKALEQTLGINSGKTTTDGLFTLETVNCLGACALAPVVIVNENVYGKMSEGKVQEMIGVEKEGASDR